MSNDFEILRLKASYETFGIVIEFLAGVEPFARYDLGNIARVLQYQLRHGDHLAAVTHDRLVGYCGWLQTTKVAADAWLADAGPLAPLPPNEKPDTAALTIVAARDRATFLELMAAAKRLNPYDRIYYKREDLPSGKKRFVRASPRRPPA